MSDQMENYSCIIADKNISVADFWWEENTFCIEESGTGVVFTLENAWPKSIKFGQLECNHGEEICIVGNTKHY